MKICILGAGVVGVTSAYELARAGHAVTVIERQPEPARECSFANGGQLSYSHAEPWANPNVFPKLWKWMWQEDAPLVLRFSADIHMIRWGLLFLLNCLPAKARANSETMLRLGLYSRQKMAELLAEAPVEFHRLSLGTLHIYDDQKTYDNARRQADFQHKLGGEEVALSRDACVTLEPTLAHASKPIIGGLHAPIDESGDIHVFTKNLADICATKYGVKFLFNTGVRRVHQAGGAISHLELERAAGTSPPLRGSQNPPSDFGGGELPRIEALKVPPTETQGRFDSPAGGELARGAAVPHSHYLSGFDAYVMAMGSHSAVYLRQLGLYVPIYPMKGYSISFDSSEFCPQVTVTDDAAKQVYTKLGGRMRVAGTAEFAGYNEAIRQVRIDPLKRGMREIFPKAAMDNLTEWACLRPSMPDGPPIVGKTPIKNLFINSGHGTLGWTQAAGSARLLADVIDGKPTEIPLSGLEIERCLIRI